MPQARSGGSRSTSRSTGTSTAKRTTAAKTSAAKRTAGAGSTAAKRSAASTSRSTAKKPAAGAAKKPAASAAKKPSAAEARLDVAAQRLRKLNERIIDAGKDAGESTLTSYETALKSIANAIEKGPGSSEVEWLANLATTQAKFIRDVTTAWTKAARARLK
jgi:hypothetical protein